jgi:hypothetical protein
VSRRFRLLAAVAVLFLTCVGSSAQAESQPLDLTTFLNRLISVDHLPEWTAGKTQMSSTWDRKGANHDGTDFKRLEGDTNILLDADGPGCVHRIFTGRLADAVAGTRIKVFLDGNSKPVFDMPVNEFFDDKGGPFPYPLVSHKSYPGVLFPIPFAKHCRIELFNPEKKNWGNYWQVTYTRYGEGARVKSLTWPLSDAEKKTVEQLCRAWLRAESVEPEASSQGTVKKRITLKPGDSKEIALRGSGVIRDMRLHVSPGAPEVLEKVKIQLRWDGSAEPAVDMPVGYFFGNIATGFRHPYSTLLVGVCPDFAYCRFPMPFSKGATVRLENESADDVTLKLDVQVDRTAKNVKQLGRFRATLEETKVEQDLNNRKELPRFGKKKVPVHQVLELEGTKGKYAGVFLHVDWPLHKWWGEGDWLIWTDEKGWPPSYHGTGSEEYFNSGWCLFDKKAVSGIINAPTMRPGHVGVYSYHLNDSFPFEKNVRVAVEIMPWTTRLPKRQPYAFWRSTAYWYEFPTDGD